MATSNNDRLAEQLQRVERETIQDGVCYAEVAETRERRSEVIIIEVELPTGRHAEREFAMPQTASDKYEFVRFLNAQGLTLGEVDRLVGMEITVKVDGDTVEFQIPERDRTRVEQVKHRLPNAPVELSTVGKVWFWLFAGITVPMLYMSYEAYNVPWRKREMFAQDGDDVFMFVLMWTLIGPVMLGMIVLISLT